MLVLFRYGSSGGMKAGGSDLPSIVQQIKK